MTGSWINVTFTSPTPEIVGNFLFTHNRGDVEARKIGFEQLGHLL
jgi:hypothetical protein